MIVLTKVTDLGDDVLQVQGYDDGAPTEILTGRGHVSAMHNHFAPESYVTAPVTKKDPNRKDGHIIVAASLESPHLHPDAKPREMTEQERRAYWVSLLEPTPAAPVLFVDETAVKVHQDAVEAAEREAAEKAAQEAKGQEEITATPEAQ